MERITLNIGAMCSVCKTNAEVRKGQGWEESAITTAYVNNFRGDIMKERKQTPETSLFSII